MSIIPFPKPPQEPIIHFGREASDIDVVGIDGFVILETNSHLLFARSEGETAWIAKSHVLLQVDEGPDLEPGGVFIEIPQWLAEEKGLV